jgi:hypothetical protein
MLDRPNSREGWQVRAAALSIEGRAFNTHDRSSLTRPFGGFKQPGFGRDRSPHAIDKLPTSRRSGRRTNSIAAPRP